MALEIDRSLDIDGYTPSELRALEAIEQLNLLNDLLGELKRLGDVKCTAIDLLAHAKISALKSPMTETKAAVLRAKADFDKIGVMISARKQQASLLQTLLRSPAA